jgi:ArsR family transcriptional regulator, cadmium/lead-responsive transcriptional repressor
MLATSTDLDLTAKLFHAFSDRTRLALLDTLAGGEMRVADLVQAINGTQGNISGHLACLKGCGLVTDRPEGRQVYYRIAHPQVVAVLRAGASLLALNGTEVSLCQHYEDPTT